MIAVVATDQRNGIGIKNQLLCHLPDDLKHFKNLTLHQIVVMGRKTFESIGRPLPNRVNVILSKKKTLHIPGVEIFNDTEILLQELPQKYPDKKIIIIGGEQVYKTFYPLITEIHRTLIHHIFDADAFFPEFEKDFQLIETVFHPADEKHVYSFEFQRWIRKK